MPQTPPERSRARPRPAHRHQPARARRRARLPSALKPRQHIIRRTDTAITYALNQWQALCRFVDDERLPLDNNRSESALRKVALGRKNFLFVRHEAAGENLAGLYALVATCEANAINPEEYLGDVLLRVQTHPNSRLDELLPHEWKRLRAADSS